MNETVSVIIPTHNYARFLPPAIESVLAQTRPADEIIVVDDGSTDDTAEVVARYAERGVRFIYRDHTGANAARNTGIRESWGSLVAFLDADDEWLPDKLALQVAHFERYPAVGLVTGSEWVVDDSGEHSPWLKTRKPVGAKLLYPQVLVENMVGNPSVAMVRRECLERVGIYDESLALAQEWDLWIRIAHEYPVGVVDAPLIRYRRHETSMTAGQVWGRYASNRAFQRLYIRPIPDPILRARLLFSAQSMNLFYAASEIEESGERRALAFALSALSVLLDPLYEARLKWALLLRAGGGQRLFTWVKGLLSYRLGA